MFSLGKHEEVPIDEYPFIGFGISWLTEFALRYHQNRELPKPGVVYLDETPTMAGADHDLIYWWHKAVLNYPELENRARIRMIQNSLKSSKFRMENLQEYVDFAGFRQEHLPDGAWRFRVSRIGIDIQSRQAIGHFYVDPANCYLNLGATLVMGWDEENTIYLIKDHPTIGPGK
jgi:hypothetical protein